MVFFTQFSLRNTNEGEQYSFAIAVNRTVNRLRYLDFFACNVNRHREPSENWRIFAVFNRKTAKKNLQNRKEKKPANHNFFAINKPPKNKPSVFVFTNPITAKPQQSQNRSHRNTNKENCSQITFGLAVASVIICSKENEILFIKLYAVVD